MGQLTIEKKECDTCGYVAKDAEESSQFWVNEFSGMDICNNCYMGGWTHLKDLLDTINERKKEGKAANVTLKEIEQKLNDIADECEGWEDL